MGMARRGTHTAQHRHPAYQDRVFCPMVRRRGRRHRHVPFFPRTRRVCDGIPALAVRYPPFRVLG